MGWLQEGLQLWPQAGERLVDIAITAILLAIILVLIFWPPPPNKPLVAC